MYKFMSFTKRLPIDMGWKKFWSHNLSLSFFTTLECVGKETVNYCELNFKVRVKVKAKSSKRSFIFMSFIKVWLFEMVTILIVSITVLALLLVTDRYLVYPPHIIAVLVLVLLFYLTYLDFIYFTTIDKLLKKFCCNNLYYISQWHRSCTGLEGVSGGPDPPYKIHIYFDYIIKLPKIWCGPPLANSNKCQTFLEKFAWSVHADVSEGLIDVEGGLGYSKKTHVSKRATLVPYCIQLLMIMGFNLGHSSEKRSVHCPLRFLTP